MRTNINLATTLGLQPLDRLQLSNSANLTRYRDEAHFSKDKSLSDLDVPFWFFRRVVGDTLEVASPSGYIARVTPSEVCDIIKGTSVSVMAMPTWAFLARSGLTIAQRQSKPDAKFFRPAKVIGALRGRYGYQFEVWFDDAAENVDRTRFATLDDDSQKFAVSKANSSIMPVSGGYGYSANKGVKHTDDITKAKVTAFMAAALRQRQEVKTQLLELGDRAMTRSMANRLLERCQA